jgi:hypothetical protein
VHAPASPLAVKYRLIDAQVQNHKGGVHPEGRTPLGFRHVVFPASGFRIAQALVKQARGCATPLYLRFASCSSFFFLSTYLYS